MYLEAGNIRASGLDFMEATESMLPGTTTHIVSGSADRTMSRCAWSNSCSPPVPDHLTPDMESFGYKSYASPPLGVDDGVGTYDLNAINQLYHPAWTSASYLSAALVLDSQALSMKEEVADLGLNHHLSTPSLSNDHDASTDRGMQTDLIDPFFHIIPNPPVAVSHASVGCALDTGCSFSTAFDVNVLPQSELPLYNQIAPRNRVDHTGDGVYVCQWHKADGHPCNEPLSLALATSWKQVLAQHLSVAHDFRPSNGKLAQKCRWAECPKELKQESIVRHILTVHLRITMECKGCGTWFARQDSLQRHVKNSCGVGKGERR